jgi:hypothetical protein
LSNEITHSSDQLNTVYAHVFRFSDKYIYVTGTGFEAVGTWNDARAQACDVAMLPQGDAHFGDFPAVARDTYFVQIKLQAGANPSADDLEDGQGVMYWDGSKEINISTEIESWQKNG